MSNPILYRRRIIPDECVMLKDDIILSCDRERIVTSWKTLTCKSNHRTEVSNWNANFSISN